jgi:DUF177 domain-containing protein
MFARHFIDVLGFARNGEELRGEIPVSEMPRLQDLLVSAEGSVSYVLRGWQNRDGKSLLELALQGELQLRCQRCLQGMPYLINTKSQLMPVPENELGDLVSEEEGIDLIPVQDHMNILEMIEEEILLGLPLAPRHESGKCNPATGLPDQVKENPFAVLGRIKEKKF